MANKKDLAKKISKKTLLSSKESLQVVEALFESIIEELELDEEVSIVGFGKSIEILDLQSDADMCAWGEEYGENGLLRKVNSF